MASSSNFQQIVQLSNGNYVQVPASAWHLLQAIESGLTFDELASKLSQKKGHLVEATDVEVAYTHVRQQLEQAEDHRMKTGHWFRFTLLPESLVNAMAQRLAIFYRPAAFAFSLAFIITMLILAAQGGWLWAEAWHITPQALGLFVVAAIIHELGHATACAYFGARPKEIGFVIYLIFPSVYSDVTDAWSLKRWQRVIVNSGGLYFHLLIGAVFLAMYRVTGWGALQETFIMIVLINVMGLVPIWRFDGYWIVADALGVSNLGQQPIRIMRYGLARWRGQAVRPLPWSGGVLIALVAFTIISIVGWGYMLAILIPAFWTQLIHLPENIQHILFHWQLRQLAQEWGVDSGHWTLTAIIYSLATTLISATISIAVMLRMSALLISNIKKLFNSQQINEHQAHVQPTIGQSD